MLHNFKCIAGNSTLNTSKDILSSKRNEVFKSVKCQKNEISHPSRWSNLKDKVIHSFHGDEGGRSMHFSVFITIVL